MLTVGPSRVVLEQRECIFGGNSVCSRADEERHDKCYACTNCEMPSASAALVGLGRTIDDHIEQVQTCEHPCRGRTNDAMEDQKSDKNAVRRTTA